MAITWSGPVTWCKVPPRSWPAAESTPPGAIDWVHRYLHWRKVQDKKPHTPGVWVVYFSLAALPIVTTLLLYRVPVTSGPAAAASAAVSHSAGVSASGPAWAAMLERWALPIWSFGVLFFSLRLVWASRQVA